MSSRGFIGCLFDVHFATFDVSRNVIDNIFPLVHHNITRLNNTAKGIVKEVVSIWNYIPCERTLHAGEVMTLIMADSSRHLHLNAFIREVIFHATLIKPRQSQIEAPSYHP